MVDAPESAIKKMMAEKLAGARAGNARDAAVAAALVHCNVDLAKRLGINSQYDRLLSQVFFSSDAELVVCVAEQIAKKKILAANVELARRFFDRAETLSPFMGAYVLGRLVSASNKQQATRFFAIGQKAGHIPSGICRHRILAKQIPIVGLVIGIVLGVIDFLIAWRAIRAGQDLKERFWRYRDVFPNALEPVDEAIGADRADIFGELKALGSLTD